MGGNSGLDLIEATLEATGTSQSDMLGRCAGVLKLIRDGGVFAEDMAVTNSENPGAGVAVLVLVLTEEEGDATLSILVLPLRGSNAKPCCQKPTNIVGGVSVLGDTQKGWTGQLLHNALEPLYHSTVHFVSFENSENVRRSEVCVMGCSSGIGPDPDNNRTDTVLSVLAMGYKTSCMDARVTNLPLFQHVPDLGGDSVPDRVERRVEDSVSSLGRDVLNAVHWTGKRSDEIVRPVKELRRVDRDTVVVGGLLPLGEIVRESHGDSRANAKCERRRKLMRMHSSVKRGSSKNKW